MFVHTPGPWQVKVDAHSRRNIVARVNGEEIVVCVVGCDDAYREACECGDAALIISALDMHAALHAIVDSLKSYIDAAGSADTVTLDVEDLGNDLEEFESLLHLIEGK